MDARRVLLDLFSRVGEHVHEVADGLTVDDLSWVPAAGANPIGWLLWHIGRVEDAQVADLAGEAQVWEGGRWAERFGVAPDPGNTGYGHTAEEVAAVRPDGVAVLGEYYDAVAARTTALLQGLTAADLDRVVDPRWDPPVTMAVRLVSIADDAAQHSGQAAYLKGLPR